MCDTLCEHLCRALLRSAGSVTRLGARGPGSDFSDSAKVSQDSKSDKSNRTLADSLKFCSREDSEAFARRESAEGSWR